MKLFNIKHEGKTMNMATVSTGRHSAQGQLVSRSGDKATVRIGKNTTVTGTLISKLPIASSDQTSH